MKSNLIRKILEQVGPSVTPVIVKLFKFLTKEKKNAKNREELLGAIRKYSPYLNIPKGHELYLLELYALNYREDGDYSNLTKGNFIDPRMVMTSAKITNSGSDAYSKSMLPFRGSNLSGVWTKDKNGDDIYQVTSYNWYPIYIYRDGKWYENIDKYSNATAKQINHSRPYEWNDTLNSKVYLLTRDEMSLLKGGMSHEDIMKKKKEDLKKKSSSLTSRKISNKGAWLNPRVKIKFKINSIDEVENKILITVDIYDVMKVENGKTIPTPQNYLKGEIPNITTEKIENQVKNFIDDDLIKFVGPKFDNVDDKNIEYRFNHLKK